MDVAQTLPVGVYACTWVFILCLCVCGINSHSSLETPLVKQTLLQSKDVYGDPLIDPLQGNKPSSDSLSSDTHPDSGWAIDCSS